MDKHIKETEEKQNKTDFDWCYSLGVSLGLSLNDIRSRNGGWYHFIDETNEILIKHIAKKSSNIRFNDISELLSNTQKLIIVMNDLTIYSIDVSKLNKEKVPKPCKGYIRLCDNNAVFYPKTLKMSLAVESKKLEVLEVKSLSSTVSRYKSIVKRNFSQLLRYKLFEKIKSENDIESFNCNSIKFKEPISEETKNAFKVLYKDMTKVREKNKFLEDSNNKLKCQDALLADYYEYYQQNILSFKCFNRIWNEQIRICGYCGISEEQIALLNEEEKIHTKRFYSRGKTMEIDKKDAFGEYTVKNIILSCYWCNNAKTDEFTLQEFEYIAKGIHNVWKNRLLNHKNNTIIFLEDTYKKTEKAYD